jgi:hypothetical protein
MTNSKRQRTSECTAKGSACENESHAQAAFVILVPKGQEIDQPCDIDEKLE